MAEQTIPTEASYYRARYYDPSIGRFMSEDAIGFDGGADFYSYVYNDPSDFSDPFGLRKYKCNGAK
jgi:RHS repeat-associated protein